jgi:hypothetical protein
LEASKVEIGIKITQGVDEEIKLNQKDESKGHIEDKQ